MRQGEICLYEWSPFVRFGHWVCVSVIAFWSIKTLCRYKLTMTRERWLRSPSQQDWLEHRRHMWLWGEAAWRPEEEDQGGGINAQKSHCCDAFAKFLIPRTRATMPSHGCIGQARILELLKLFLDVSESQDTLLLYRQSTNYPTYHNALTKKFKYWKSWQILENICLPWESGEWKPILSIVGSLSLSPTLSPFSPSTLPNVSSAKTKSPLVTN